MFLRKEKAENCYYPTFFCMDIDTSDDLTFLGHRMLDPRTEAAFLHEYIHYLQDITTKSGYAKINSTVDQLKWVATIKGKLKIPCDPCSTYSYNIKPNEECMRLSQGNFSFKENGKSVDIKINSITKLYYKSITVKIPTIANKNIAYKYLMDFTDQYNQNHTYEVGEYAISESMAYLIESLVYPGILPSPTECPYKVVEKILQKECPQACKPLVMIAICDVCLNFKFPGYAFYKIIQNIKNYTIIEPALIYILWEIGEFAKFQKLSVEDLKETKKQVTDYFIHNYWNDTSNAVSTSIESGWNLRNSKKNFFLDIATGGPLWQNKAFNAVYRTCGCMCIKTSSSDLMYIPPIHAGQQSIRSESFVCLNQIHNILLTNAAIQQHKNQKYLGYKCSLKDWCSKSFVSQGIHDFTQDDMNCIESPWENRTKRCCEFGRLWSIYKLGVPKLKD